MDSMGGYRWAAMSEELNELVLDPTVRPEVPTVRPELLKEWRYIIKMSLESTEKTLEELSRDGWEIFSVMPTPGANYAIAAYRMKQGQLTR